jgi:hypothetical protein
VAQRAEGDRKGSHVGWVLADLAGMNGALGGLNGTVDPSLGCWMWAVGEMHGVAWQTNAIALAGGACCMRHEACRNGAV